MDQPSPKLDSRPLYAQVRELLLARIQMGDWGPGAALPNEFDLAREMGVSQGTVRKALDGLTQDHILVRRQGRGTFVVEQTPANELFRFFNLYDNKSGAQILPDSRDARVTSGKARALEFARLQLEKGAQVVRIERLRTHDGLPFIAETIVLPDLLFPGLAAMKYVPNTLYDLFQKSYGVMVARTDERLEAVGATKRDANALNIAEGAPLLRVDRVTYSIDGRPVEWRLSLCHLDGAHYRAPPG